MSGLIVFFILGLDCGRIINLSNGGFDEIKMTSYTQGKVCTWLVKVSTTTRFYGKTGEVLVSVRVRGSVLLSVCLWV